MSGNSQPPTTLYPRLSNVLGLWRHLNTLSINQSINQSIDLSTYLYLYLSLSPSYTHTKLWKVRKTLMSSSNLHMQVLTLPHKNIHALPPSLEPQQELDHQFRSVDLKGGKIVTKVFIQITCSKGDTNWDVAVGTHLLASCLYLLDMVKQLKSPTYIQTHTLQVPHFPPTTSVETSPNYRDT